MTASEPEGQSQLSGQNQQHTVQPPMLQADREQLNQSQLFGAAPPSQKTPGKLMPAGLKFGAAGLILGVFIGIAGTSIATAAVNDAQAKAAAEAEANKPKPLPEAVEKCKLKSEEASAKLGDDGHSLSLDSEGKDDFTGLSMTQVNCVLEALKMPDSIYDQIGTTRALDGTQRDSWDVFSVSWNYHPDSGLNVNLKQTAD